jgi:hypothetical protein
VAVRLPALVAAAVVAAGCGSGGGGTADGVTEADYVRANERVLRSVPLVPGAREVGRSSSPYYAADAAEAPPAGYTTLVVYELAARVPQRAVIDHYVAVLSGWRSNVEYARGVDVKTGESRPGAWSASFVRRSAVVGVNTDNLVAPSGRRFEVSVDHRGAAA